jgi:hypothetical protein
VIGHDRNTTNRVLFPEELDLFDCGGKIIASMDNDKQLLLLLEFAREQIVSA